MKTTNVLMFCSYYVESYSAMAIAPFGVDVIWQDSIPWPLICDSLSENQPSSRLRG